MHTALALVLTLSLAGARGTGSTTRVSTIPVAKVFPVIIDLPPMASLGIGNVVVELSGVALGQHVTVTRCPELSASITSLEGWVSASGEITVSALNRDEVSAADPDACEFTLKVTDR